MSDYSKHDQKLRAAIRGVMCAGMTDEDASIWERASLETQEMYGIADTADYYYFRDYTGCDLEVVRAAVRAEAYAAAMYGTPDYSDAEAA